MGISWESTVLRTRCFLGAIFIAIVSFVSGCAGNPAVTPTLVSLNPQPDVIFQSANTELLIPAENVVSYQPGVDHNGLVNGIVRVKISDTDENGTIFLSPNYSYIQDRARYYVHPTADEVSDIDLDQGHYQFSFGPNPEARWHESERESGYDLSYWADGSDVERLLLCPRNRPCELSFSWREFQVWTELSNRSEWSRFEEVAKSRLAEFEILADGVGVASEIENYKASVFQFSAVSDDHVWQFKPTEHALEWLKHGDPSNEFGWDHGLVRLHSSLDLELGDPYRLDLTFEDVVEIWLDAKVEVEPDPIEWWRSDHERDVWRPSLVEMLKDGNIKVLEERTDGLLMAEITGEGELGNYAFSESLILEATALNDEVLKIDVPVSIFECRGPDESKWFCIHTFEYKGLVVSYQIPKGNLSHWRYYKKRASNLVEKELSPVRVR